MKLRLGELFAGYGGLGVAVEEVFGAELAWVSEWEAAPSKILAHHWPHVPNHGDVTKIDWNAIEPVDIISGGSPCQDLSLAGKYRGMHEGTRSNLWESMREGIATIRPRYVVWENVRGSLSAEAVSDMEQPEGRLGADGEPNLRAIGRVLGDLADLGYDCQWRGLRAADVGAPHGRFRVFILAANAQGGGRKVRQRDNVGKAGGEVNAPWHHRPLNGGPVGIPAEWGKYQRAIQRWEGILGRRAPAATYVNERGKHRLSPHFTEWMMGLPAGWVTDPIIGLTPEEGVTACGNGVVPQQATAALRDMLAMFQNQERSVA